MFKTIRLLPGLAVLLTALPSQADVTVGERVLQKGLFSPPQCKNDSGCLCEADIKYPVLAGMADEAQQETINNEFRNIAEQLKCQGEPASTASKGDNFSITHTYELTFQSPDIIGLKFTDLAYEGGAHSNGAVEGMIIDLHTGKPVTVGDLFDAKNLDPVNKIIYHALLPKSEGVFRDEIENRKGAFIKDNKCQGCTVALSKKGISVVFQAYEVAPFADGNPSVAIPAKYVSYPAIVKALAEKQPEKK